MLDGLSQSSHLNEDVRLTVELLDSGTVHELSGTGNGPIAAFVSILNSYLEAAQVRVLDYSEHALSAGGDARAAAYLECEVGGRVYWGVGIDPAPPGPRSRRSCRPSIADFATLSDNFNRRPSVIVIRDRWLSV